MHVCVVFIFVCCVQWCASSWSPGFKHGILLGLGCLHVQSLDGAVVLCPIHLFEEWRTRLPVLTSFFHDTEVAQYYRGFNSHLPMMIHDAWSLFTGLPACYIFWLFTPHQNHGLQMCPQIHGCLFMAALLILTYESFSFWWHEIYVFLLLPVP
jgi:hypothetical protein